MKIVSIQVGLPKAIEFRGRTITTGIFKNPVNGPVLVEATNLRGDKQADLTVHGGIDKAVYGYSLDAYSWWQQERPQDELQPGAFGENLTIDSLHEDQIFVGDTFEVGTAVLQAVQPRLPCYKLGIKFNDKSVVRTFMESGRPGVYFRVLKVGTIEAGDEFKLTDSDQVKVSILKLFSLYSRTEVDRKELANILQNQALATDMREQLTKLLDKL
ncbi:MAG TPA: MOSC domain-containing protein [Oligoflexus sp.]|uniref:MOSC domain-containing protein n=1 Tax=Oligoflexus sp. TaxID=1971216 RepID=UPI002D802B08|nr:MOSC domain-containing protein [Oligoflexus sp.]HET9236543.1 MOSC domain-containing protein [Oligoflexus sp.]